VRARRAGPIEVIQQHLEPVDLTVYERIPSATVARALLDCRGVLRLNNSSTPPRPPPTGPAPPSEAADHQRHQRRT